MKAVKSDRLFYLNVKYRSTLKQCTGHEDDRLLFINCYNLLVDAIREFESLDIKNPIIKLAFSDRYHKEAQRLDEQFKSLVNRGMITVK